MTAQISESVLPSVAHRLNRLPPYGFAKLNHRLHEMAAAGFDVIRLDIGSPDMPPPDNAIETLKKSASNPKNHSYGGYKGDPAYRRAVAAYYERRYGVALDPDHEVLPLIGSKEGIVNIAMAFIDNGDAALVPTLGYPAYSMGALMAGGDVIDVPLDPNNGYKPDLSTIKNHPKLPYAKLLWLNYPNNPTGAVVDLAFYEEMVEFCRARHILLCSDNPYAEVVYDGYRAPSALQAAGARDIAVEFFSMSKMFNKGGWRLGACVGNRQAIDALLQIKSNVDTGHFKPIYDAGTSALNDTSDSWIEARNARYQARRDKVLAVLPELGVEAHKMLGSLYVWARVWDGDDLAFTEKALNEAHVSIAPGQMFGPAGRGYLRISVATDDHRLDEALDRLRACFGA